MVLSQFSDNATYVKVLTKIQVLQPNEIIMPTTACENGNMSPLFEAISQQNPHINLTTVQRKYFNETKGLECIKDVCVPEFQTVEMDVQNKYYCLATTAALVKYTEFVYNMVLAAKSLKVLFKGGEKTMLIDNTASSNLELVHNARDPRSLHSLYGVLNHTKTPGGGRLLRSNILQPPCDISTITQRYDCITELTEKEGLFRNLQTVLSRFLDVDQLISCLVQIPKKKDLRVFEKKIADSISLKHVIELIPTLQEALKDSENGLFKAYYQSLSDPRYENILEEIGTVIHDETHYHKGTLNMRTQKLFSVKPNVNGLLDVARRSHCEVIDDITEIVQQEAKDSGLPFTPNFNSTRGFHMQLTMSGRNITADQLPPKYVKVLQNRNVLSCTTEDLIKLNTRLDESLEEIYFLSNLVLSEMLEKVREYIGCLHKLAECVSMLDLLVSFAHACTLSNYVRPEFTDTLAIKEGRHPILDKISTDKQLIGNDVFASDQSNFTIITGPNMSGKSTYLRQIALLQIMAQCGSFVPAAYASFRLCKQVFVRIGSDDDIETNCSTFKLEMKEMHYILQNITDNSLLIIDELGRGTGIAEGVGISYSICEKLISTKAFTFFATHFLELCDLSNVYHNVENYHMVVQHLYNENKKEEKLAYTHTITKEKTDEMHYGIQLAEFSNLPEEIIEVARTLATENESAPLQETTEEGNLQKAKIRLGCTLKQAAKHSQLDTDALKQYLEGLKMRFLEAQGDQ
uniref:DNA mismatch repair proteins mutS family domain-containing protein n=2 Tax=Clytia hemisphaerica TaxID=252671 RepID=A0A7M6DQK7_9CNID